MSPPDDGKPKQRPGQDRGAQDDRKSRLAERLRANLQRRKAQARSRRDGGADSRPEGLLQGEGDEPKGGR